MLLFKEDLYLMVVLMKNRKWFILGLSALFIILTILVKFDLTTGFDNYFYKIITLHMNNTLTNIFKVITFLGSTGFIIALCAIFLIVFIIIKHKNKGFIVTSVLIISTVINNGIKLIIQRERPDVIKLVTEHSFSFPSGHTMASVSMYGILMYLVIRSNLNNKLKIVLSTILGIIPILVAISRVYLGAHYITDVIGGIIMSTILLLVATYYIDKKKWI